MALADRTRTAPSHGLPCSVGVLLKTLPPTEADALQLMLGSPEQRSSWTARDIFDALTEEGHTVGYQSINRHRGRMCRCWKAAS